MMSLVDQHLKSRQMFMLLGIIAVFLLFPIPSEMADFMIGCSIGNFRPSSTCDAVCRLLHNRSACCYGVNYDSRAVCACCDLGTRGTCPTVCGGLCHIITLNAGNCSELRGSKHRSGGGPSIINDLSILSDHLQVADGKGMRKPLPPSGSVMRAEIEGDSEKANKTSSSTGSTSSKSKNSHSTTNKLFQRLSSTLDLY